MPSFDIVSKLDKHELTNAVDQANREVKNRFDFKDTYASFELNENIITLTAPNKFQLQQMLLILEPKLVKRNIELNCLEREEPSENLHEAKQKITIKHGIDHNLGKKINKIIKDSQFKVQSSVMGDHIRVNSKKRDDLQNIISLLKEQELEIPLQFENFRE